ncbi:MAG: amino acid ABC transporter permease [Ardenticatenaceae bacterium]|nr:amino acid ABC transporter permease [Ardenticatenaceae bacterium]
MTTLKQNSPGRTPGGREVHFNLRQFLQENLMRSWPLTLWLVVLIYLTGLMVWGQLQAAPALTLVVLVGWLVSVGLTAVNEITRHHNAITYWLKNNLYSSISNTFVTLLLLLLIIAGIRGFIGWAFIRASFTTDPEAAVATLEQFENPGANWGAVADNMRNLMVFRWPRSEDWRLWFIIAWNVILFIPSQFVYRREAFRKSLLRRVITILWVLTPAIAFLLLRGLGGEESFLATLNPDQAWGGFLLTLVVAIFAIVASFPLGVLLALGRRSQIRGVPARVTYGVAILLTAAFLITSTFPGLRNAQTGAARVLAFWPLLIPLLAYLFQRVFKGNVVALFSTFYIETVRGVPFITVLFMSIILFPIFLPPGLEVLGTWRVMVAAALFAAAYLAENVRGGLQSLNKGQYEAADALGLNTLQKYRFIILPQALRIVIPAIVGQFIGLFKDTTLVAIVGLVEFLGAANLITAQPDWLGVRREPYVFIALVYFVGSAVMAGYSRRLEAQLGVGQR